MKRKSVDPCTQPANLAADMTDQASKPTPNTLGISPAKAERDARLAKALRSNLRRRKAPASPFAAPDEDAPKAD